MFVICDPALSDFHDENDLTWTWSRTVDVFGCVTCHRNYCFNLYGIGCVDVVSNAFSWVVDMWLRRVIEKCLQLNGKVYRAAGLLGFPSVTV